MGADLFLELARRNARFRAWRACGVPVDAAWRPIGTEPENARKTPTDTVILLAVARSSSPFAALVEVRCEQCCLEVRDGAASCDGLRRVESEALRLLRQRGCLHLTALAHDVDPPEVVELAELELLAHPSWQSF